MRRHPAELRKRPLGPSWLLAAFQRSRPEFSRPFERHSPSASAKRKQYCEPKKKKKRKEKAFFRWMRCRPAGRESRRRRPDGVRPPSFLPSTAKNKDAFPRPAFSAALRTSKRDEELHSMHKNRLALHGTPFSSSLLRMQMGDYGALNPQEITAAHLSRIQHPLAPESGKQMSKLRSSPLSFSRPINFNEPRSRQLSGPISSPSSSSEKEKKK